MLPLYTIRQARGIPSQQGDWNSEEWKRADTAEITYFRPESSDHRPQTAVRLLYDRDNLFGIFRVRDRYVRCVHTHFMDPVCRDSCVELFIKPKQDAGYFGFELNCGGTMLLRYIVDPTRSGKVFREFVDLSIAEAGQIQIYHSMPKLINPEITEPVVWTVACVIPFSLLEKYVGQIGNREGQQWSGNFYKCGDETSHPHWAAWSPVKERNFHMPNCFGTLIFSTERE